MKQRTGVDFRHGLDDHNAFQRLVAAIRGEAGAPDGYELPDEPAPYRGLERFDPEHNQLLLGELGPEALREAVKFPARKVGAFFESGLVEVILRDVHQQRGSPPRLQHALKELWQARRGPWLTLEAYEKSGGVAGALSRRAQYTYEEKLRDHQLQAIEAREKVAALKHQKRLTKRFQIAAVVASVLAVLSIGLFLWANIQRHESRILTWGDSGAGNGDKIPRSDSG